MKGVTPSLMFHQALVIHGVIQTVCSAGAYGKAGNGNEMETGNGNGNGNKNAPITGVMSSSECA